VPIQSPSECPICCVPVANLLRYPPILGIVDDGGGPRLRESDALEQGGRHLVGAAGQGLQRVGVAHQVGRQASLFSGSVTADPLGFALGEVASRRRNSALSISLDCWSRISCCSSSAM
jgi:hypothetical protein